MMAVCKNCKKIDGCNYVWKNPDAPFVTCVGFMLASTWADKVRHMTDEELANKIVEKFFLDDYQCPPGFFSSEWACEGMGCVDCWFGWLRKKVKE